MEFQTNLEGKSLRCRIDGINFVSISSHQFLNELSKDEEYYHKSFIIRDSINKFASVFRFDRNDDCISVIKNKLTINLNELYGIYMEGFFKGADFFLIIQFKGFFFIQEDAFDYCRSIMLKVTDTFNEYFRISLVDIAQDFFLGIRDVLPNPNTIYENLKYCFKYKSFDYNEKNASSLEHSGFVISSSRYKITVYNKVLENAKTRKPEKKKYYEDLYGKYDAVTRVELRLKQEFCKTLTKSFFSPLVQEETFIGLCLRRLFRKHKLRYQPQNSKDNDWRRWPIHPNWEYLFGNNNRPVEPELTMPDYKYTSGNEDVTKPLSLLVETLVNNSPNITKKELIEKIESINLDQILQRVQANSKKRIETLEFLKNEKFALLNKYNSGDWLDLGSGDSSITSPVKRKLNDNSNACEEML